MWTSFFCICCCCCFAVHRPLMSILMITCIIQIIFLFMCTFMAIKLFYYNFWALEQLHILCPVTSMKLYNFLSSFKLFNKQVIKKSTYSYEGYICQGCSTRPSQCFLMTYFSIIQLRMLIKSIKDYCAAGMGHASVSFNGTTRGWGLLMSAYSFVLWHAAGTLVLDLAWGF